jgi:Family of unknown function (DUF6502)
MEERSDRSRLLEACGRLLIPVIRFLLRGGVSWKEFSEIAKTVFVKVATEDFGIRGRPTNASRVAILTGLDRREVRRQREALKTQEAGGQGYMTKASQVLAGWHHDPEFRDSDGNPRPLSFDAQRDAPGFSDLVRKYAPALPAVAMLKELKAASSVEERPDGLLRALTRFYIPRHMPEEQVRLWSSTIRDLATAVGYNFTRAAGAPAVFERRAVNLNVDAASLVEFKAFLEKEGQAFLLRADDWLAAHEAKDHAVKRKVMRLGVGVYHIQDKPEER